MRDFSFGGIYKTVLEVLVFVLIETADPYIFEVLYYLRRRPTLHSWLKSEKNVIWGEASKAKINVFEIISNGAAPRFSKKC